MEAHSFARSDGGLPIPRSRKLLSGFGDERLVAQLRRGNQAAFEVLYDRHHAAVLSYCRHMLGSRDEAEDALQQAFVSAHADIVSSEKPIRFKAWIYTIARNRCLSILRSRREQPSDDIDRVSTVGLGEEVQHRADLRELLADLQELPDDQRDALILAELGDLSHVEVADVIDCEVAKVKSLVFQARSGLLERREARETPCHEIREQLATLRGGSLRRGPLRRHLKACPGCTEFREEVRRQRQAFAALLPVVPTVALKENALAAVGISAGSAATGALAGGGAGAVFVAKAGVAKVAVIAVTTTGAIGGAVAVEETVIDSGGGRTTSGPEAADEAATGASSGAALSSQGVTPGADVDSDARPAEGAAALAGVQGEEGAGPGTETSEEKLVAGEGKQGFEPIPGGSNGERAREFVAGSGNGNHHGVDKRHPGAKKQVAHGGSNGKGNAGAGPKPKKNTPQHSEAPGANGNGNGSGPAQPKPEKPVKPEKPLGPDKPLTPLLTPPTLLAPDPTHGNGAQPHQEKENNGQRAHGNKDDAVQDAAERP